MALKQFGREGMRVGNEAMHEIAGELLSGLGRCAGDTGRAFTAGGIDIARDGLVQFVLVMGGEDDTAVLEVGEHGQVIVAEQFIVPPVIGVFDAPSVRLVKQ